MVPFCPNPWKSPPSFQWGNRLKSSARGFRLDSHATRFSLPNSNRGLPSPVNRFPLMATPGYSVWGSKLTGWSLPTNIALATRS